MPINVKNLVVKSKEPKSKKTLHEEKRDQLDELLKSKDTFLIVAGKIKKISKKSKYLVDMLTLED